MRQISSVTPVSRIAILYPSDPLGHVPSGIDSFVRGILKWAPEDLEYTLIGASSDVAERPLWQTRTVKLGERTATFLPVVATDPRARRSLWPLTVRYLQALRKLISRKQLAQFDVLDFHRIEPGLLLLNDPRPKNIVLHQDMAVLRQQNSDILWRHAPWLYERLERRVITKLSRVFSVRESAIERYKAQFPQASTKFAFIPTWVDTTVFRATEGIEREQERLEVRNRLAVNPDTPLLIFVGRLDRQKDPMLLLEVFREVRRTQPDAQLIIVGDGVLRQQFEAAAQSAGVRGVIHLVGAQPPAEIARLLRASDLFVLSSAYEGMPIAVLEALATGLPVVSTDVGELRRIVVDAVNGRLSPERTPQALAQAITTALAQRASMRGEPCTRSIAAFGPEAVLSRMYENHRAQGSQRRVH